MISELFFAAVLTFGGFGSLLFLGIVKTRPELSVILSLPVGVAVNALMAAAAYSVALDDPTVPFLATCGLACLGFLSESQKKLVLKRSLSLLAAALLIVGALLYMVRFALSPIMTFDSYKILLLGNSIGSDSFLIGATGYTNYPLTVLNLQAGGSLFEIDYVIFTSTVAGLLAIFASVLLLCQSFWHKKSTCAWAVLGACFILGIFGGETYMLRSQLVYLNSHLLTAGFFALGSIFILFPRHELKENRGYLLTALIIGVVSMTRVEGMLFEALLLSAYLSRKTFSWRELLQVGFVTVGIPGLWYARLAIAGESDDAILTSKTIVIMMAIIAGPLLLNKVELMKPFRQRLPLVVVMGLLGVFWVAMFISDSGVESSMNLLSNAAATGLWGSFWWTFGPLAVALAIFGPRLKDETIWIELLGGALLLILLLGTVRSTPYRLGWGDSGNRMLVHIAPLTVLYVCAKIAHSMASWSSVKSTHQIRN